MKMEFRLSQEQKLVMTTELRQAIALLQFSSSELIDFLNEELIDNPLLEMDAIKVDVESLPEENREVDLKEYFENYEDYAPVNYGSETKEGYNVELFTEYEETLYEHLMKQLNFLNISEDDRHIGEKLIQSLDSDGYLRDSIDELSDRWDLESDDLERVLELLQTFEPIGICARTLEESLLIQAFSSVDYSLELEDFIVNHLDDLANNRMPKIAKEMDITVQRAQELADIVRSFNPKPASQFTANMLNTTFVLPDASVEVVEGELKVNLNDVAAPNLYISSFYGAMLKSGDAKEALDFLNEKYQRAIFVMKAIEQRRNTIENVINAILIRQKEFFTGQKRDLVPMTLKDIAEDIDMHESTVSRTVNGKYIDTPLGIFELKYFFTTAIETVSGDTSAENIKQTIVEIVDGEDKRKPFSDQAIVEKLNGMGIKISRRTIAKYRDELNIPSTSKRRRY